MAFRLFGFAGFAVASALAAALAWYCHLSLWIIAAFAASGAITFLALAMGSKIVTGVESLTYYHHQTAVLLVSASVLWSLHLPLLPYLDIDILGIGVFLVFGRIGCLRAGCCFGLPWSHGVRYGRDHIRSGFPRYLAEVPLFPVQAIESACVFGLVCLGASQVVHHRPPGSALSLYMIGYALLRFFLEFFRGGTDRPFAWDFSEAQWTSFGIVCCVIGLGARGALPFEVWHVAAVALIALGAIVSKLHSSLRFTRQLLHPAHIEEFAQALDRTSALAAVEQPRAAPPAVYLAVTQMGIQVSFGFLSERETPVWHYTLSHTGGSMTQHTAKVLANLVFQLTRSNHAFKIVPGPSGGVYHLLLRGQNQIGRRAS